MNHPKNQLDQSIVQELFQYDSSGNLVWKDAVRKKSADGFAGTVANTGYRQIGFDGKKYQVHVLVWNYFNGKIPEGKLVDHINHKKTDNRFENLRLLSNKENLSHRKVAKNNKTGHTGVFFNRKQKKWFAVITVNGKKQVIGRFENEGQAIQARKQAEQAKKFSYKKGK